MAKSKLKIKDRIIGFERIDPSLLDPNPRNWRRHPDEQKTALEGVLSEIGFAGAILVRKAGERYQVIDGHLRHELLGGQLAPVLITDLTQEEADLLLAVYDPITGMAETDKDVFAELLNSINEDNLLVSDLLASVRDEYQIEKPAPEGKIDERWLKDFDLTYQEKPVWILVRATIEDALKIKKEIENHHPEARVETSDA